MQGWLPGGCAAAPRRYRARRRQPDAGRSHSKAFSGAHILYTLRLNQGGIALSLVPSHHNHALGEKIGIKLMADHVVAFPRKQRA